jgi:hypothetical protein
MSIKDEQGKQTSTHFILAIIEMTLRWRTAYIPFIASSVSVSTDRVWAGSQTLRRMRHFPSRCKFKFLSSNHGKNRTKDRRFQKSRSIHPSAMRLFLYRTIPFTSWIPYWALHLAYSSLSMLRLLALQRVITRLTRRACRHAHRNGRGQRQARQSRPRRD